MSLRGYSGQRPDISVIVCHHVGELLFDFLESLSKSTDVSFEVIVMTSDEQLALEGINGCLVFHHVGMPAAKRNAGARIARGKYLAFFDDDVTIHPLCLYHQWVAIQGNIGMTYGKLWNMEHRNRFDEAGGFMTWTGFIWSRAGQNDIDTGQFNEEEYVLAGKSASCMVRRDIFKRVGGFDEDFGILGEETDLSWRIWLDGYKILYVPTSTGYHAFNTRFKPKEKHYTSSRVHFNGCRNYITMLIKNLGKEHLWIVPIHMMIWFTAGFAMLCTLRVTQGLNIMRGLGYVVRNLPGILRKRRRIQETRSMNESDLWKTIYRVPPRWYGLNRFTRYLRTSLHG